MIKKAAVQQSYIVSNKIDRAYRGISIFGTGDMPLTVTGNSIYIEEDYAFGPNISTPAPGYGIYCENKMDNMSVTVNTLACNNMLTGNNTVALVYCKKNYGNSSPFISCNQERDSQYGFEFEGNNKNTVWQGNNMCNNWAGLALVNQGEIGTQGSSSNGCGNVWSNTCTPWGSPQSPNHTYCESSDPMNSQLYVLNTTLQNPSWNSAIGNPAVPYSAATLPIATACTIQDCLGNNPYGPVPAWRQANPLENFELTTEGPNFKIFPNPTNNDINIEVSTTDQFEVRVCNAVGLVVL